MLPHGLSSQAGKTNPAIGISMASSRFFHQRSPLGKLDWHGTVLGMSLGAVPSVV
jgi:hypothetical protein